MKAIKVIAWSGFFVLLCPAILMVPALLVFAVLGPGGFALGSDFEQEKTVVAQGIPQAARDLFQELDMNYPEGLPCTKLEHGSSGLGYLILARFEAPNESLQKVAAQITGTKIEKQSKPDTEMYWLETQHGGVLLLERAGSSIDLTWTND